MIQLTSSAKRPSAFFASLMAMCLFQNSWAQTNNSYPMLMSLKPTAAIVGQTSEHELSARYNLAGGNGVIISGSGVRGQIVPLETEKPEDKDRNDVANSKCKLKITCDPDAMPGIRDFRLWTPHGVSTVGQLVIARELLVNEVLENDTAVACDDLRDNREGRRPRFLQDSHRSARRVDLSYDQSTTSKSFA
jgi:hypothetical protein